MIWDWKFAWSVTPEILVGLKVTLQAVAFGTILASVLGLIWAVLRRSEMRAISWPVMVAVEFIRSTPLLVQIFFVYYVIRPAVGMPDWPLATGIVALGIHYSAYMSEVYRAGLSAVPPGQWEAATALNLNWHQTYRHVILPQAIPPILPALGNYVIAMFKDTPMLSAVAILEILQRAKIVGKVSFRYLEPLTIVGVTYLVLSIASALAIRLLQRRLQTTGGAAI